MLVELAVVVPGMVARRTFVVVLVAVVVPVALVAVAPCASAPAVSEPGSPEIAATSMTSGFASEASSIVVMKES